MAMISVVIVVFVRLIPLALGSSLAFKPAEAIEIQRKFYERIN